MLGSAERRHDVPDRPRIATEFHARDREHPPRVLVVEDDPVTLNEFARFLTLEGFDTALASTCADAIRVLDREPCEAVLADLRLPDGTALEVLAEVRKRRPSTAFLLVSGFADVAAVLRVMRSGPSDCFEKPVDPDELVTSLRALTRPARSPQRPGLDPRISRALAIIDDSPGTAAKPAWIAERVGLGASRLRHLFRREIGCSLTEYGITVRRRRAQQLLRDTDARISEIAFELGFENASSFSREFRRQTGQTPRMFRASASNHPPPPPELAARAKK